MSAIEHGWELARIGTALAALIRSEGLDQGERDLGFDDSPPQRLVEGTMTPSELGAWLEHQGGVFGCELEPSHIDVGELERSLPQIGPALLLVRGAEARDNRVIALGRTRSPRWLRVLGPDLVYHRVSTSALALALAEDVFVGQRDSCEAILEAAQIPARRRERAREALLHRRMAASTVDGIWQLRLPPSAAMGAQLRQDGALRSLVLSLLAHFAQYILMLGSWFLIGRGILQGRSEFGWLLAWALLLLSLIPLRAIHGWHSGLMALRVGGVLKRRLLAGALALEPDETRTRGIGRLLALVIESEAVESLAISTGLASVSAILDMVVAAWVINQGAGGGLLAILLWVWVLLVLALAWRYGTTRLTWARERLSMTHALVERMVGHTTRLAQEPPERWHASEDAATAAYFNSSRRMDRLSAAMSIIGTRGWMFVAAIGLWPVLVVGRPSTGSLAIAFGGVLLAQSAFGRLSSGMTGLADLVIAWGEVHPLADAAARGAGLRSRFFRRERPTPTPTSTDTDTSNPGAPNPVLAARVSQPVIDARELGYRYPSRERPVLRNCDLRIEAGERLLLEGPSGGGKSTLAAMLAGLRQPDTGLLLLEGLDRPTHGELGWRQRVAAAPQFHQNHVLTNTFAFNLLMGRRWPPLPGDFALAVEVCEELGLGPLLERMPAGMTQNVGETGWQLSHGERSRLYLARALLQGAQLVILDESLAALDPENQRRALECAFERAPTLLVIAHP